MKRLFALASLLFLLKISAQTWATEEQYIQKFAPYAVEEMEKFKIPASITLAQGLLETGGGQSRLAKEGNNHFGIKCKEEWTGKTMKHTDDAPNECFRVYDDPRESYEDHSKFLAYRKYYQNLFNLDPKDYKAWAFGLKKAGYATNPKYAHILIGKIEKYKLYEYDNTNSKEVLYAVLKQYPDLKSDKTFMAQLDKKGNNSQPIVIKESPSDKNPPKKQETKVELAKSNKELLNSILVKNHPNAGKKFFIVPADTNVAFISKKFGINENKIKKWNELSGDRIQKNDIIFLETKSSTGNVETYKAKSGESMHDIAQKFGIKLSKLYSKNRMDTGKQPKTGQLIYLQKKKPRS